MEVYPNELLNPTRIAILQAILVIVGTALGLILGQKLGLPARLRAALGSIESRPWLAPLIVGLFAFLGSALVSNTIRWPHPSVHDEFGYLLIADTFMEGRLTNPTPHHWEHFEVIHTIMHPTYQSKFFPGNAAMIYLGMLISGGTAAVGLWLGVGLACAAATWALMGVVGPRWAFLGGMLASMHLGFFSLWSQSYWGGSTAMLGGALMFGAALRLARRGPSLVPSIFLGAGLFILSFTRPYEGLIASLPIGVWLFWKLWQWSREESTRARALQVLAVQVTFAALILGANGIYNHAVTGSALRMPYIEYQRQYSQVPEFVTLGGMEPERRPERFDTIYGNSHKFFETLQGTGGFLGNHIPRVFNSLLWISSIALLVPFLVGFVVAWRLDGMRAPMISFVLTLSATSVTYGVWPHYYAPVAALFTICATIGLRTLWKAGGPGRGLVLGASLALAGTILAGYYPHMRNKQPTFADTRQARINDVLQVPGDHLVLVEYTPKSNPFCDWVYNRADIESSRIIWATSLGEEKDAQLIAEYPDRLLWIYDADAWWWRVTPEDTENLDP